MTTFVLVLLAVAVVYLGLEVRKLDKEVSKLATPSEPSSGTSAPSVTTRELIRSAVQDHIDKLHRR